MPLTYSLAAHREVHDLQELLPREHNTPMYDVREDVVVKAISNRLILTQVCKSWHLIAVPLLWADLFIDIRKSRRLLVDLCKFLSTGTHIATHATNFMIFPYGWVPRILAIWISYRK